MHAMVLRSLRSPLEWTELPDREPKQNQIRVKILACGVCRTDLHVVDGELPDPVLPIIPGHEIVGRIDAIGSDVIDLCIGQRVGIPWLGHTCGVCPYCLSAHENLCDHPLFTGFTRDGGFATAAIADARFAFPLEETGSDVALAPLLCAGLIGWRSLVIAGEGRKIGLYGFGAAAQAVHGSDASSETMGQGYSDYCSFLSSDPIKMKFGLQRRTCRLRLIDDRRIYVSGDQVSPHKFCRCPASAILVRTGLKNALAGQLL